MLIILESSAGRPIWQDELLALPSPRPGSAGPAPQSSTQREAPSIRLKSELIQLSVFVTGERGRPVTHLRQQDLVVLEDGVAQEVTYFSAEGFDARREAPRSPGRRSERPRPASGSATRTMLVLADDLHISQQNMMEVKRALLDFVNFEVRQEDWVAFVSTSGSLGFLQQLTDDRAAMRLAVNRLSGRAPSIGSIQDELSLTPFQADLVAQRDPQALAAAVAELQAKTPGPQPGRSSRDELEARAITMARRVIHFTERRAVSTIETLSNAIRSLQRRPGAKFAIFISDGLLMSRTLAQARSRLKTVIDAATRSGVVVYTLDAGRLQTNLRDPAINTNDATPTMRNLRLLSRSAERLALQEGLRAIARDTGGKAFLNNNDLEAALEGVLAENNFFYLVGYHPSQSNPGGPSFRQIDVRVKGRPDLAVRVQRGYLAVEPQTSPAKKSTQSLQARLQQALQAIAPHNDIGLTARSNFLDTGEYGSIIITSINVDARTLKFQQSNDRRQTALHVSGLVYDARGELVHSFSKALNLNLKQKTYQEILQNGLQYNEHVAPGPGLYQVRVAVLERSTGRLGSASQWVDVPDLSANHIQLSDIFFLTNAIALAPAKRSSSPQLITEGKLVTPTVRVFEGKSSIDFGFYVYNAIRSAKDRRADLVVQIQIVRNNVPVFTSPVQQIPVRLSPDLDRIFFGSRLPLNSISPGRYVLQVTVIDRQTRQHATERIDFTVI